MRGCYLAHVMEEPPRLRMFKIVDDTVSPADPDVDIDRIVSWLCRHGYVERGAFIGQDEACTPPEGTYTLAVFWLKPGDEPEHLSGVLGCSVVPATVRYVAGEKRFATTRTASEIWRSRRRNPYDSRDLAYIRLPTKAELARAYGLG
jgi:hypothetical protein